jgi:hypothetical protein
MVKTLLWMIVIGLALGGLHALALWAERRGWIYYRHRKASPGTAGRAFMEVQSLLEPGVAHIIQSESEDAQQEDDAGDPPA